jgi:hypothetical protein
MYQLSEDDIGGVTSAPQQKPASRGWRLSGQSATEWLWRREIMLCLDWLMFQGVCKT